MTTDRETLQAVREDICEACKGDGPCWEDAACYDGCEAFQDALREYAAENGQFGVGS